MSNMVLGVYDIKLGFGGCVGRFLPIRAGFTQHFTEIVVKTEAVIGNLLPAGQAQPVSSCRGAIRTLSGFLLCATHNALSSAPFGFLDRRQMKMLNVGP